MFLYSCYFLAGCRDKFSDVVDPTETQKEVSTEGVADSEELFEFEASMDSDEELRTTIGDIGLIKRSGDPGKAPSPEYRPIIKFRNPALPSNGIDTEGTYAVLALCRINASGGKAFFRVPVRLSVTHVFNDTRARVKAWVKKGTDLNYIFKVGPDDTGISFHNDTWHAMLICGGEEGSAATEMYFKHKGREAAMGASDVIGKMTGISQENGGGTSLKGDGMFRYNENAITGTQNLDFPIASNWQKLNINKTTEGNVKVATGTNTKFTFKPQGLFLTYHLGVNINYGIDMRRIGVVSNALDFQGKYKLDDASLKKAYDDKDSNGFGVPEWEGLSPDATGMQGLGMYAVDHSQDPGLFGDRAEHYPWDMPLIQDIFTSTINKDLPYIGAMPQTIAEGSVAMSFPWASAASESGKRVGMRISGGPTLDAVPPSGNKIGFFKDYATYVQWAMPKTQVPAANKRFTYMWVQANSSFRTSDHYAGTISDPALPRPEERLAFIRQISPRVQPMVVVHQTNADFTNQKGKTPHMDAVLTSDLMISEIAYKYRPEDRRNYSVVELHNTTQRSIDLNDYALVRLIDDGGRMRYRTDGGQGTDNLPDAEIFYLRDMSASNANYNLHYTGQEDKKAETPDVIEDLSNQFHFLRRFIVDGKKQLLGGQLVLLGASGYVEDKNFHKQGWFNTFIPKAQRDATIDKAYCRYLMGCKQNVLSINPGDGLALIRLYDGGSTMKVIDTTAPIGASNYGFAGTYADYKAELNRYSDRTEYSQRRMDGVVFPFMPPYRTERVTTNWADDWEVHPQTDLGDRNYYMFDQRIKVGLQVRYITTVESSYFSTKATPMNDAIKPKYKAARPVYR